MKNLYEALKQFFSTMFISSSAQADEINRLFLGFVILSAVILAIVSFMVIGGIVKYRESKRKGEAKQIFGNNKLELVWTIIPFMIVTVLFFLSLKVMEEINEPIVNGQKPDIDIIAHQWWWDMRYPKQGVNTANELHIPTGKKLLMRIQSADVIHSWWVPALGRKTDAIPGHNNFSWIEADSSGEYEGTCSEYCGNQHAWMRIKVIAEPQADFDRWIQQQKQPAAQPMGEEAKRGEILFQEKTCGNCHTISGTPANGQIAPDLSHIASRETLLSGMMANNKENLKKWLENPQNVKKGSNMPNFLMSEKEVNELVAYLEQLK